MRTAAQYYRFLSSDFAADSSSTLSSEGESLRTAQAAPQAGVGPSSLSVANIMSAEPQSSLQTSVVAFASISLLPPPVATETSWFQHPDPISWVPFATRLVVADYLQQSHPYCVGYALASWPESVLPQTYWEYFHTMPATSPSLPTVVLRLSGRCRLEVRPTSEILTVADVLRSLYSMRAHFPNAIFTGLSYMGTSGRKSPRPIDETDLRPDLRGHMPRANQPGPAQLVSRRRNEYLSAPIQPGTPSHQSGWSQWQLPWQLQSTWFLSVPADANVFDDMEMNN
ncbi:hypothetical protein F5887DRAFT_1174597 [Amanita rubescens]|nr:hypothetical protein F5887DRAFT_1174597 [Amanita rubescens]